MEFTKDEIEKFAYLVKISEGETARKFLSSDKFHITTADVELKNDNNKDDVPMTNIIAAGVVESPLPISLEACFYFKDEKNIVFSDGTLKFIKSIIERRLNGLSLIYTDSAKSVYFEGDIAQASIDVSFFKYDPALRISIFDRPFDVGEYDADFSANVWSALCSRKDIMMKIFKYSEYCSSKIQKRIQTYYDNLSNSDKLLLELGEELA